MECPGLINFWLSDCHCVQMGSFRNDIEQWTALLHRQKKRHKRNRGQLLQGDLASGLKRTLSSAANNWTGTSWSRPSFRTAEQVRSDVLFQLLETAHPRSYPDPNFSSLVVTHLTRLRSCKHLPRTGPQGYTGTGKMASWQKCNKQTKTFLIVT